MKYNIWDDDNAVLLYASDSRRMAVNAIMNYLVEAGTCNGSDIIIFSVGKAITPDDYRNYSVPRHHINRWWL